jgi:ethanolamine ammonia-lyase large subunit
MYATVIRGTRHAFPNLKTLMAKAAPSRSGDRLAGVAASNAAERVAAQMTLADLPFSTFLREALVPYEDDEVTRAIFDAHDAKAFAPVSSLTVGELRDWLLSDAATGNTLAALSPGLTPEMVAAVAKISRNQDLVAIAAKHRAVTRFRDTLGLAGTLEARLMTQGRQARTEATVAFRREADSAGRQCRTKYLAPHHRKNASRAR